MVFTKLIEVHQNIISNRGGEGVIQFLFLADIIYEQPLMVLGQSDNTTATTVTGTTTVNAVTTVTNFKTINTAHNDGNLIC